MLLDDETEESENEETKKENGEEEVGFFLLKFLKFERKPFSSPLKRTSNACYTSGRAGMRLIWAGRSSRSSYSPHSRRSSRINWRFLNFLFREADLHFLKECGFFLFKNSFFIFQKEKVVLFYFLL